MPYITREDGEHFVIPSYRDVLTGKQKSALKKEILLLSQNYGEYITLQRKSSAQYEVAFSPDTGYLLGESIWHYFKRPLDMIYCEAIPNTTEAILVIVKAGSVYLDGSFPLDSIPEELVIFLTQQNYFDIYLYGEVPISQVSQEGKFSFETGSVKSFTVLDQAVFPTLPLLRMYQLQLVDPVLKKYGIGVFPTRQALTAVVIVGLLWMAWSYLTTPKQVVQQVFGQANPYQLYNDALISPAPDQEIKNFLHSLTVLYSIPGWMPKKIKYTKGNTDALVRSSGSKVQVLLDWVRENNASLAIQQDGIYVTINVYTPLRPMPKEIYPIKQVLASFIDKLATVYPGNHLEFTDFSNKGAFTDVSFTININEASPMVLALISEQLKALPFILQNITLDVGDSSNGTNNGLTGSITIEALGS